MKAVVLAAGKGQRLKSVVRDVPKPMVRVRGRPILEQNVCWLRDAGVQDIYMNLHHLPEVITKHFGGGEEWGVRIMYSRERRLLGTAGAVRKIADDCWGDVREPFLVVYGDNLLSGFDLRRIVEFHNSRAGAGTICLHYREDVSHSGIAVLDSDGRILRFVEKPTPDQAVSHWVNAGLYVLAASALRYVPQGTSDFGRDIFPRMLEAGERLYGLTTNAALVAVDTPEMLAQVVADRGWI